MNTFSPQHISAGSSPRNSLTPSPRGHRIPPGPVITTSTFSPQHIGAGSSTRRNSTSPSPGGHRIPPGPRLSYIPLPAMTPTTTPAILGNSPRSLEPLSPPPYEQVIAADQHNQQRTPRSRRTSVGQHASGSGPGLGFEAAAQPTQSPSTLSPLRSFLPSPQAPRRSPVYESRSSSPMPTNTRRPLATSSRAAPSHGYNAAPTYRAAVPRSPPPEALNTRRRRRRRRRESLAQQQLPGPSVHQRASPGRGVAQAYPPASFQTDTLSSPAVPRRHSVQPPVRAQRASHTSMQPLASGSAAHRQNPPIDFVGPPGPAPAHAHAVPQYTGPASTTGPAGRVTPAATYNAVPAPSVLRPAPAQQPAFTPIAAKRAHDAEHVQKCARRVRRKQEKAEEAARQADAARRSVERAERDLVEACALLRDGTPETDNLVGRALSVIQSLEGVAVPMGASSGFSLVDVINMQPGAFTRAFEAVAEDFGVEADHYLRNPAEFMDDIRDFKRLHQQRDEFQHTIQIGEAGPSSYNTRQKVRGVRALVASPKTPATSSRHNRHGDVLSMHV